MSFLPFVIVLIKALKYWWHWWPGAWWTNKHSI